MAVFDKIPEAYPHLREIAERQLALFPEHRSYLEKRFTSVGDAEFAFAEDIATKVEQIAEGDLDSICLDYKWLSSTVLEEEIHFRRTGRYRLSTFEEADAQVYSNRELMSRYMNGLLASQLWWKNHTEMLRYFRDDFVGGNPPDFAHLEIGPGHGLFLYLAASAPNCGTAEAWDVSDASLANTRDALLAMKLERTAELRKINLFDAPDVQFNSIAFSEVLEHLEEPRDALEKLHHLLADEGRLFINAPINSPAPDHLYLFKTPEHMVDIVTDAGFVVESSRFAPCTGASLERARKQQLSISVGLIVRKR